MAIVKAIAAGNASNGAIWSGGVVPGTGDSVWSNTFAVVLDISMTCISFSTYATTGVTAGGSFTISTGVNIVATGILGINCLGMNITANAPAVVNITAINLGMDSINGKGINVTGTCTINTSGTVPTTINNGCYPIYIGSGCVHNHTGNVYGGSHASIPGYGIYIASALATVNLIGNATAMVGAAIYGTGAIFTAVGTQTASATSPAIQLGSEDVTVSGILVNVGGVMAVYTPKLKIYNGATTQWTFQTNIGGINKNIYTAGLPLGNPPTSDVRYLTQYGAALELTGTAHIPTAAQTLLGVLVDATIGTLIMTPADFWAYATRTLTSQLPVLGADNKVLISTDSQDLSTSLHVDAKKLNGNTPNNATQLIQRSEPDNISIATILSAINDVTNGLAAIKTAIGTRMATFTYTAPDNTNINNIITAISNATYGLDALHILINLIPTNPLLSSTYTAPDNIKIGNIKDDVESTIFGLSALKTLINDIQLLLPTTIIASKVDVEAITPVDISGLATQTNISDLQTHIDINLDAKISEISNLNENDVETAVENKLVSYGVAKTSDITSLANLNSTDIINILTNFGVSTLISNDIITIINNANLSTLTIDNLINSFTSFGISTLVALDISNALLNYSVAKISDINNIDLTASLNNYGAAKTSDLNSIPNSIVNEFNTSNIAVAKRMRECSTPATTGIQLELIFNQNQE